jgi:hypothetical protein
MRSRLLSAFALWLALPPGLHAAEPADRETFFETKIRPVIVQSCLKCHGPDKARNNLRLDSRAAILKGGDSGPAVVPSDPDASILIEAIRYKDKQLRMPPTKRLADDVVADFETWVRDGAVWPADRPGKNISDPASARHWAFEALQKREPPPDPTGWAATPVDRFIMFKMRERGVVPVAPAEKRTLLRRVTFDLIGLPPSPAEIAEFLKDASADALVKVVERLLESPHYGERWGRHWMDVARYADTAGDNADYPIPESRLYRDYIIDAFNRDKPYDQFIREQVAGDLLAKEGPPELAAERTIATGFIALSRRYATAPYELMHLTLEDTIDTVGRSILGLTLRCARCHDHKFDPVTKEDYYALYGVFASTKFPYAGSEEFQSKGFGRLDFVPLLPAEQAAPLLAQYQKQIADHQTALKSAEDTAAKRTEEFQARIKELEQHRDSLESSKQDPGPVKEQLAALIRERDAEQQKRQNEIAQLKTTLRDRQRPGLPEGVAGAYAVSEGTPVHSALHIRGEPGDAGPVIHRGVLKFLAGENPPAFPENTSGRLELARWLTAPENPLTARVMVNRIWQQHFGKGIVTTPSNFGLRGEEPTHPKLLDYLARRFIETGWSIKAMHREILLSKTYQLASADDAGNLEKDASNHWYWRYDRRRLDAESIRDALLAVSGRLDRNPPTGPHPFPPMASWSWTQHAPFKEVYPTAHRSVYLMTQRIQRHPYLALFDSPDTNTTTDQRFSSTVPLQALFLMNNPWVHEQSEAFAQRLISAAPEAARRIQSAYETAYGRPAQTAEIELGNEFCKACAAELERTGCEAPRIELETWTTYARILLTANEFFYLD